MAAPPRRRKIIGHRRPVEDEGEDDGPEQPDLDEDSLTEGSIASDEDDPADNSDTSNIDEASPTSNKVKNSAANGAAKLGRRKQPNAPGGPSASTPAFPAAGPDTDTMMNGLSIADPTPAEMVEHDATESPIKDAAPVVVSSSSATQPQRRETVFERQRREHEAYRQRRDEDPAFVPNRGAFFMHDHRGPGPSANGFRPFPRSTRGGRGRGLFQSHFAPMQYVPSLSLPYTLLVLIKMQR